MKFKISHIAVMLVLLVLCAQRGYAASVDAEAQFNYDVASVASNDFAPQDCENVKVEVMQGEPRRVGQPLPGVLLTALVAGGIARLISSLKKKSQALQKLLEEHAILSIIDSYTNYLTQLQNNLYSCQVRQHTVLRL